MSARSALLACLTLGAFALDARAGDDVCAIEPEVVPDFALVDVNPNSPGYGTTMKRDDYLGRVVVIYWAVST